MLPALDAQISYRLLIALVLGLLIGLERELNKSSAGLKTHTLVSLGSALFTVGSLAVDTRILAGLITGIGFIGAGVIWKNEKGIGGLTTAATLWMCAAIGFIVGIGFWRTGVLATLLVLFVLVPVEYLERRYVREIARKKGKKRR